MTWKRAQNTPTTRLKKMANRYEQASPVAMVNNLSALIRAINEKKLRQTHCDNNGFGVIAKSVPWVRPSIAAKCVAAIDSLPMGASPENFVYLSCNDLLSGPGFTWDLRDGDIPETGSSQTVAHTPISLAPGRDYFAQFVPQGECESLLCDGFAAHYYSESRCNETLKDLLPLIGESWSMTVKKRGGGEPQFRGLVATFTSRLAKEVSFTIYLSGQGEIRGIPDMLLQMENGKNFFNVKDNDQYGRVYPGSDVRGHIWQYP